MRKEILKASTTIRDTQYNPYRVHNFLRCGARQTGGHLHTYEDGQKRLASFCCSETTHCPECADKKSDRVASSTLEFFQAVAEANSAKRCWFFVFTLPERYEDKAQKDSKARKKIFNGLKILSRKLYGVKTRDLIPAYCIAHSIGDTDVFRDRTHFHMAVLPVAVRRPKGHEAFAENVDLDGLIDLEMLKKEWHAILRKIPWNVSLDEMNVRVEYIPMDEEHAGKLRHRIQYDLRGFGADFMKSAIYYSNEMAVLEAAKNSYQIRTIEDIAKRWMWVRQQRDLRTWGTLAKQEGFANLLKIEKIKDSPPAETNKESVTVTREVGRLFDPDKRRVRWVDTIVVTGKDGKVIKGWEYGRLKERMVWRPRGKPIKRRHPPPG